MTTDRIPMMGIFSTEDQAASAIRRLRQSSLSTGAGPQPHSQPMSSPTHCKLPKSKVGWFTLAGGIVGFLTGFLFAAFTATRWSLMVSGKAGGGPGAVFLIVGFEFTILFAVFGNVLGIISQARLPRFKVSEGYDPRFSGNRFGVLASCLSNEQGGLSDFFKSEGAEIKRLDSTGADVLAS